MAQRVRQNDGPSGLRAGLRVADWSLRLKMAVLLVVASLFPLGIGAFTAIRESRQQLLTTTGALLAARGDQLVGEMDTFNRGLLSSAEHLAGLPGIVAACGATGEDVGRYARAAMDVWPSTDPKIRGVALLDWSGMVTMGTEPPLVGRNPGLADLVQRALRGHVVVSDVFVAGREVGYAPTIAYLVPVRGRSGAVLGLVALWVRALALWDMAKTSNGLAGPESFAVLFDQQGIRIAHTYNDGIVFHPGGALDGGVLEALVAEGRFGPKTRELLQDVRAFPEQFKRARAPSPEGGLFRGFAPVNSKWNYGVARRLKTVPWTLFYMIPEQGLNAQIAAATRETVFFAAAIMFGALLAGSLFAGVILKPVRALSTATEALAHGDLTARLSLGPRGDELGRLGQGFNSMASRLESQARSLEQARDDLELKVQERTAQLVQSQARLTALSDAGIIGIIVGTLDGRIVEINDALLGAVGYTREEILSGVVAWRDLTPPEWRDADDRARESLRSAGVIALRENEYIHKNGARVPVMMGSTRLAGTADETISFVLDLTANKQAAVAVAHLRESRAAEAKSRGLAAIVDSSGDAIIGKTLEGVITSWNEGATRIFGYASEEIVGKSVTVLIPPERDHEEQEILAKLSRGERVEQLDTIRRRKDGRDLHVCLTSSPVRDANGKIIGASKIVRDITERIRAEEALSRAKEVAESASRELEAFSYSVAHDLRAPLRGMNGFAQVLLNSYSDKLDAQGQDWLAEIVLNAKKMGELIDGLLSLARVTRSELKTERVDLTNLAREAIAQLAASDPHRAVTVHLQEGLRADADPRLARALLDNLLGNAWKFTGKATSARIDLGATDKDGQAAFFVRDNGAGFDMAFADKLFAPFQRLHTAVEFSGTGIGLATAQRIVHRHGGRIWAEGAVDVGATFYFTFPVRASGAKT